jgi:hypothetical protein
MSKALQNHCDEHINVLAECDCALCEVGGTACIADINDFSDAPDEMIHKWYAMVFPEAPTIKDSGQRRVFETGATRDCAEGKGRFDLLPWAALLEVAKHAENGSKKYGEHNVDKGLPTSSFLDSAVRHIGKHLAGWTDEPHLEAAAWNCLWAVEMTLKHPELVDTPWTGGAV